METVRVHGLDGEGPGDIVGAFVNEGGVSPDAIGEITVDGSTATVAVESSAVAAVAGVDQVGSADVRIETPDGPTDDGDTPDETGADDSVTPDDSARAGDGETVRPDGARTASAGRTDDDATDESDGTTNEPVEVPTDPDGSFESVAAYADRYAELVELEREAEMERHEREIRELSGREREAKGRAILHVEGRDEGESVAGHEVKFVRQRSGEELPDTEISPGDLVMVSKQDPTRDDNPTGTVTQVTNYSVTVAFDGEPPGFVFGGGLRLDHYVNDITFQRMLDALETLRDLPAEPSDAADAALARHRDALIGDWPAEPTPDQPDEWFDEAVNEGQRGAVAAALGADPVSLIHGPPGTGKTTTAVEVIRQLVARGERVMATAASNTAVDNVLERLIADGVDAVRVGHPARVTPAVRQHTLDARLEDNETYRESERVRGEAFQKLEAQDDLTAPSGRWRRGLSDDRIRELAEEGRGSRGVPSEKIAEMAEWLELRAEADELFERADELEQTAIREVLTAADVICTTNATAGSEMLADVTVDSLVIDEATQATEPSCLIPLVAGRPDRLVLAGDHRQLPPTIQSETAARRGLDRTLFERLADAHDGLRTTLRRQYRMHRTISDYAARAFYDGRLEPDDSVADHTLAGVGVTRDRLREGRDGSVTDAATPRLSETSRLAALDPDAPAVFLDTTGLETAERSVADSPSRENPAEAEIVAGLAADLIGAGVDPADLAVVSPYQDQVDRLRRLLAPDALEVDTVDGFQGREKAVVLVSLVRANDHGSVGFLTEDRRFNVAVTRARRKVIVVGDGATVTEADAIDAFHAYAADEGRLVEADGE